MLDLQLLPLGFVECLVIGHLNDQIVDRLTKRLDDLLGFGFRVLECVVKNRGCEHVGIVDSANLSDEPGNFGAMADVGTLLPSLSTLLAVPVRREVRGLENQRNVRDRPSCRRSLNWYTGEVIDDLLVPRSFLLFRQSPLP